MSEFKVGDLVMITYRTNGLTNRRLAIIAGRHWAADNLWAAYTGIKPNPTRFIFKENIVLMRLEDK